MVTVALCLGSLSVVNARVSPEEVAQLGLSGTPLTPVGAIRAGNAEGTIPEWTGGITNIGIKDGNKPPGYNEKPNWDSQKPSGLR